MQTTQRNKPRKLRKQRDPEVIAGINLLAADFARTASEDDCALLVNALGRWHEHPYVESWFTTCMLTILGMPQLPVNGRKPLSLAELRKEAMHQKGLFDREEFVAAHLDLVTADDEERAFLVTCQKIFREIGDTPGYRMGQVVPKIVKMAGLLLEESLQAGVKLISGHTRRKRRASGQPTSNRKKARLAAA